MFSILRKLKNFFKNSNDQFVILEGIEYFINEEENSARVTRRLSNATEIVIPRSIKQKSKEYIVTIIASEAFFESDVRSVSFEPNSELRTIETYAFSFSKLASIVIPSHVTEICEQAFCGCEQLSRVEFEPNSELRTIEQNAFACSRLARIVIPSLVT